MRAAAAGDSEATDRAQPFADGRCSVVMTSILSVILPSLSRKFAAQSREAFSATLDWALRLALIITLPSAVGLAHNAEQRTIAAPPPHMSVGQGEGLGGAGAERRLARRRR